jgi:hypothetical protein
LLISTHSKKAYPLKEGSNPIANDRERIVIGNGEIVLKKNVKTDNLKIQTNINITSAF